MAREIARGGRKKKKGGLKGTTCPEPEPEPGPEPGPELGAYVCTYIQIQISVSVYMHNANRKLQG